MLATDGLAILAALVIFGMIWLRTKVQYRQRGVMLSVTRAGWQYFASAAALMLIGWLTAPHLAPVFGLSARPGLPALPTVLRVAWFLATYYLFIGVHQWVKSRGAAVFAPSSRTGFEI